MSQWKRIAAAVLLGSAVLLTGCSEAVTGTPLSDESVAADARPLGDLLLDPAAFPPQYPAVVLPPQAVSQAAPDLTGIAPGAKVEPAGCKPPVQDYGPDGTAMVVGTDNANRSTITIELIRVATPLVELGAQLSECPEVTATRNGVDSVVRTTLTPPPPIDADDTLALRRSVSSGQGDQAVTQSMLTLIAQVDDVRVQATFMSFGADADTAALDELFTAAVLKVHAG
ncbi:MULTISPECIES: sensor domain-containing protein [unclassified Rhodococcus (in: high G+C Gram-positive bacteria)]|uniref:sensor domain-containing protein n=1 Tax=unclassified Rhodococcus (in: high G+C Gram-positive bacteria) TaxID=192944 RepID=UPI001583C18D|nr:sensor domain-containing protein [Rhodococcus sp. W8901]QKT11269.1 sensor domain-containing protein [Rhodococcus sp. W8901]